MLSPKKYQTKPTTVEAIQFVGNFSEVKKFTGSSEYLNGELIIDTDEGLVLLELGEWVIKKSDNEFSVCDNETFEYYYVEI